MKKGVGGGGEKEKYFENNAKIFPNLMKAISPQMQESKEPQVQKI